MRLFLLLLLPAIALGATDSRLADLAERYELEMVTGGEPFPVKCSYGTITGKDASAEEIKRYLPLLRAELTRYPVAFISKTRLTRMVLCRDLAFAGQARFAVPDFEHNTLYLHVGTTNRGYLRLVFHHELFHVVDLVDDGTLYSDRKWAALNPPGFQYARGGAAMQGDSSVGVLGTGQPGFLNRYSTAGVEEDKAEIFAHFVANRKALLKKAAKDAVLAAKVEFMKGLLLRFCGEAKELWIVPVDRDVERARAAGNRVLLLFSVSEDKLSDERVVGALAGWAVFRFDLADPSHAEYAKRFGVRRAPTLLAWPTGKKKPTRFTSSLRPAALARWLARLSKAD